MPSALASFGSLMDTTCPSFFDDALLGLVQTEEHAHERGFACAVFAQQGVDLALFELKRNVVVGDNTGESFGDVEHLNGIR